MTDLEVVALNLTSEFIFIDSENSLLMQIIQDEILNLLECCKFNKKRRKLFLFSEEVRRNLVKKNLNFRVFIVDSMKFKMFKFYWHNKFKIKRII